MACEARPSVPGQPGGDRAMARREEEKLALGCGGRPEGTSHGTQP
jgi:hypothetical protein